MVMETSVTFDHVRKTIRLEESRINQILDGLDAAEVENHDGNAETKRYRYRHASLLVAMQQPGSGTSVPFVAHSRALSSREIAFLHGGFVHAGSTCVVRLVTIHGSWEDATGKTKSCRYIDGNLHEVVVKFDTPIDPCIFCTDAVNCTVLLVEDQELLSKLITTQLSKLNANAEVVSTSEEGIETALQETFDLIIMDIEVPVLDGCEAVAILRSKGYTGLVAAFTANIEQKERYLKAGFDRVLQKPHSPERLRDLLASIRQEPLHSRFHSDPTMQEFIKEFINHLPNRIQEIESALKDKNLNTLLHSTQLLTEEGAAYGFDPISDAAAKVTHLIYDNAPEQNWRECAIRLLEVCRLARGRE